MGNSRKLSLILPIAEWLPGLSGATIQADLIAGIALAGLLVPEGLAYARSGFMDRFGESNIFFGVHRAVSAITER